MASTQTKIPLKQHSSVGVVTVEATIDAKKHVLLLDSTFPGVVYRCDCNEVNNYCNEHKDESSNAEETCPLYCNSSNDFMLELMNTEFFSVDPIASKMTIEDLSFSSFRAGRICDSYSSTVLNYDVSKFADGVLGVGPSWLESYPSSNGKLSVLPWSKYSLYLTKSNSETGSFLQIGGIDAEHTQGQTEYSFPATFKDGWRIPLDNFLAENVPVEGVSCNKWSPCTATISTSSPVLQIRSGVLDTFEERLELRTRACQEIRFAGERVYSCESTMKFPRLGFTFGKRTMFLDQEDYTLPDPVNPGRMIVLIQTSTKYEADWILGTPFLRAFYSSFDKDAQTVTFYCKEGDNCVTGVKTKPNEWTETVNTSDGLVKAIHWTGYIAGIAAVVLFLVLLGFCCLKAKKTTANKDDTQTESKLEDPQNQSDYADMSTPSTKKPVQTPTYSAIV